ncbi:CDP-glycerol glycerophosphotransferase family protein [Apilactobacillus apisilvae]|uniref:CDP-glycerol glycerophosphotransferase family protein n=1 Tax=Apilactobacillus apisilvae TaxID=2923364 RepID=A0ABY4PIR3_9LACO|nr:CDP-glycerol glycerophosphotransferase family protein [Apilactobacillus apisilvae]UQS85715.1 CDP-glycerol glycerophosphotransferase family protein [Apilactobacillus apisilvae]
MKSKIIKLLKLTIRLCLIILNDIFIILPVKKDLVIFESFKGKDINDNPAAIYEEWINQHPKKKDLAYFAVKVSEYNDLKNKYPNVKMVRRFLPKWVWIMARANFWVFNSRTPNWWRKNKGTTYMQTWHGTPLKKLGIDIANVKMPGTNTDRYKERFVKEAHRWDYLIAPNQYSHQIFARAFDFNNKFLDIGYPRNDILYSGNNKDYINKLKYKLIGDNKSKIIMYAPTWRDDDYKTRGVYNFELPFSLEEFFNNVDDNAILIIRPHYLVKDSINISGYEDRVKIMAEEDISELYLISDLLITDYSSVMFDYANLKRPMLFFAYDLDHYEEELRGFYFNYKNDVPGPLVQISSEFYNKISEFNHYNKFNNYDEKFENFYKKFCSWESEDSSKKFVQIMRRISDGK